MYPPKVAVEFSGQVFWLQIAIMAYWFQHNSDTSLQHLDATRESTTDSGPEQFLPKPSLNRLYALNGNLAGIHIIPVQG
jgi:hypothetical protein